MAVNITLFNKKYWIRRFGEQREVKGYLTSDKTDFVASLNVHPLSTDQQQALPEGERQVKRLEAHGTSELIVANKVANTKGDLLYYNGDWYECVSAQLWDHTVLSHTNYQFVLVPKDGSRSIDIDDPPAEDPNKKNTGYDKYEPQMPVASDTILGGVIVESAHGLCIDSDGYLSINKAVSEEDLALFKGGDEA